MADSQCKPCEARGRKVKATRLVPEAGSNIPKCDSCWFHRVPVELSDGEKSAASARPDPPLTERKIPMGRRPKADWQKVQADRAAGMAMSELIEKYDVSAASIYTRTKAPARRPRVATRAARRLRVKAEAFLRKEKGAIGAGGDFAAQIRVVPLEEFPGGLRGQNDAEYQALFLKLSRDCGENQGVASRIPAAAKKCKKVAGAVRSALCRLAAAHGLRWRLICRIDGETVYVGRVKK